MTLFATFFLTHSSPNNCKRRQSLNHLPLNREPEEEEKEEVMAVEGGVEEEGEEVVVVVVMEEEEDAEELRLHLKVPLAVQQQQVLRPGLQERQQEDEAAILW